MSGSKTTREYSAEAWKGAGLLLFPPIIRQLLIIGIPASDCGLTQVLLSSTSIQKPTTNLKAINQ